MSTSTNHATVSETRRTIHPGPHIDELLKLYEKEIATYLRELPRLLDERDKGRFALIKGEEILSVWDTEGDALQAGQEKFGPEPFLVQKIDKRDPQRFAQLYLDLQARRDVLDLNTHGAKANDKVPKVHLDERGREVLKIYEKEIKTYIRELPRLLQEGQVGRYALIKGDEILSIWDTDGDAIQAGRERFGLDPICIQKIKLHDIQLYGQLDLGKDSSCQ